MGGATEYFGVQPDLFCLAKSIGGGVPIGAFGGREEVMRVDRAGCRSGTPRAIGLEHSTLRGGATRVAHLGTFNGNPLSMTAGLVTLTKVLTPDVYPRLHAMADRLTAGCQEVLDEFGLPGYAINVGPKGCVMFTPERVTNYRDFIGLDARAVGGVLLLPRQSRRPAAARAGRPVDPLGAAHRRGDRAPRRRLPRFRRRAAA